MDEASMTLVDPHVGRPLSRNVEKDQVPLPQASWTDLLSMLVELLCRMRQADALLVGGPDHQPRTIKTHLGTVTAIMIGSADLAARRLHQPVAIQGSPSPAQADASGGHQSQGQKQEETGQDRRYERKPLPQALTFSVRPPSSVC
jgi:hypothetical protein